MNLGSAIVVQSRVSVLFEPVQGIRKNIFAIEESLNNQFLAPNLIPVPDDAPGEIPRIELRSKNGHSMMQFSQIRADLTTQYDGNFNADHHACFSYIKEKGSLLSGAINVFQPDVAVTALSITVRWPAKDDVNESIKSMKGMFLTDCMSVDDLEDFRINKTTWVRNDYFLLTTVNNYRVFAASTPIETPHPSLANLELKEHGLEMELEINDKRTFNLTAARSKGLVQLDRFVDFLADRISSPPCLNVKEPK
ncbi:MAG: hypothetical protein RRB22_03580 [Gammaproteobacteria bacterium]|nr:hypothetical protein [Gammaproteobacteria bacterium]